MPSKNQAARDKDAESQETATDGGIAQVQARVDEANRKGYLGVVPDPTPNENYTVAGNDLPTPETDRDLQRQLQDRSREIEEAYADVRPLPANPADGGSSEPEDEPEQRTE